MVYVNEFASESTKLECPKGCGQTFTLRGNLQRHVKYGCGTPKRFICEICDKAFSRSDTLKSHMGLKHLTII